jgi:two-component system, chemotaxis family, chemotaxis protein CheY
MPTLNPVHLGPGEKLKRRRVLVVDDSRVGRTMVKRSLPADWNVELSDASDGKDAIDCLSNELFDVVFLDLTMPRIDGYGVLAWLKENRQEPIVIVVSADLQPAAKARVLMSGAFDFVPKPPEPGRILQILELAGVL